MQEETFERPQCSSIIVSKELGDQMQKRFETLYQQSITKYAQKYSHWCDIGCFKELLNEIQNQNPSIIDGFRIYLGLNAGVLVFLLRGINGKIDVGEYFQISDDGHSYNKINSITADIYKGKYIVEILSLPEIKNGLFEGNTQSHAYIGLLAKFIKELERHDNGSPIKGITIKLSSYINNDINPDKTSDYTNRILAGFIFTINTGEEIYLTDLTNSYGCYLPKDYLLSGGLGVDTGSPCPPKINCPT